MIERFNFYDIYGYLIPGFVLLGVLTLPGVLTAAMPETITKLPDLSAALITLIAAYVAGHLLQIVAALTIPSIQGTKTPRAPSDIILDEKNSTFSDEFKARLRRKILVQFGIDIGNDKSKTTERKTAFFLCRNALMMAEAKTYCEQFEGMYVMMRGICAASAIGFAYDVGWIFFRVEISRKSISWFLLPTAIAIAIGCVVALAILALVGPAIRNRKGVVVSTSEGNTTTIPEPLPNKPPQKKLLARLIGFLSRLIGPISALLLLTLFACSGYLTAKGRFAPNGLPHSALTLVAAAALSLLAALWTFGSYRVFAHDWAKSVYENFQLLNSRTALSQGAKR